MGGSVGKSKSDSSNQSGFNQDVWGPQGDALQNLYGQAGNAMGKGMGGMGKMIPGASEGMQGIADQANPYWQNQMQGGAYQGMDLQGMYGDALGGGGNEQFMNESIMGGAGNNYVDAMKGQMQQDSSDALGRNLASNDLRAVGAGQSGSSRHGITERGIRDASSRDLSNAQTQLGYETFDRDLDRKMGIARGADQFDMQKLQNVGGMLGNQQNAMAGGLKGAQGMQGLNMGQFAPYMAPGNMMNQYSNMIGRPTVLGSGSGSGDSSSKGFGMGGSASGKGSK